MSMLHDMNRRRGLSTLGLVAAMGAMLGGQTMADRLSGEPWREPVLPPEPDKYQQERIAAAQAKRERKRLKKEARQ